MKILHCADIHLDSSMETHLTKHKAEERNNEILRTFLEMIDYADVNGIENIIIAGDLFDTENIRETTKNIVIDAFRKHEGIMFYYLPGNHDKLNVFGELYRIPENLVIFSDTWEGYYVKNSKNIVITGARFNNNKEQLYDSLALDEDAINILVMHGQDSLYDVSGNPEIINISALRFRGIDYLALGHIHSSKVGKIDDRGIYGYSGCLEGRGYDECGEKGFNIIEVNEENYSLNVKFVKFACRTIYDDILDVTGCENSAEVLDEINKLANINKYNKSDIIRIKLCGNIIDSAEINTEFIKKRLENSFYNFELIDETRIEVQYQNYENDISLIGEFVRSVKGDDSIPENIKAEIIKLGLSSLSKQ